MSFELEYPIYLCSHKGGFASIGHETADDGEFTSFAIVMFSSTEKLERFLAAAGIEGEPLAVESEKLFIRFLYKLQAPFTAIAFDPLPDVAGSHALWTVSVQSLLQEHLPLAQSPWEYPLYALSGVDDWEMIDGARSDGDSMFLLCLFCSEQTATAYADALDKKVTPQEIETPEALRLLVSGLLPAITAVAFDPAIGEDGTPIAGTCMSSDTILEKYIPE